MAAQTSATCLMGLPEEESMIPTTTDALTHKIKKQYHTSYVRGSIEGAVLNILVDSGTTESFISADFYQSVPALHKRPLQADFIAARASVQPQIGRHCQTLQLDSY